MLFQPKKLCLDIVDSDMISSLSKLISILSIASFLTISFIAVYAQSAKQPIASNYLEHNGLTVIIKDQHIQEHDRWISDCDRYRCFNPFQCEINESKQLLFYIYPPITFLDSDRNVLYDSKSMTSYEFWKTLQSLLSRSHRITSKPEQACIFVPSIDLVWLSQANISLLHGIYDNLPYWHYVDGKPGTNHLTISLDPQPNLDRLRKAVGRSIIVSSAMDTWTVRPSFDFSIPIASGSDGEIGMSNDRTQWVLVSTQYHSLNDEQKNSIKKLESTLR